VRNTIAKYGIHNNDIYSFDETSFIMGMISTIIVVTSSERRSKPSLAQPGDREVCEVASVGLFGVFGTHGLGSSSASSISVESVA
jgi:hypothetical protein